MHIQWKWTVPNVLSLIRIAIIPVFVVLYLLSCDAAGDTLQYAAFGLLIFSGVTDLLDGIIARRFDQVSEVGKLLDPIADKLTQVAVLFCLATQYKPFLPLLFICIIKEMLQGLGGLILLSRGGIVKSSNWYGKVATAAFYAAVAAIVLWKDMPSYLLIALVALVAALMLFAFVRYMLVFITVRKTIVKTEQQQPNGKGEAQ